VEFNAMSDPHASAAGTGAVTAVLDTTLAREIVEDSIRRYIASRRAKVDEFTQKHFSRRGAWALNRRGIGGDIVKAPLNTLMVAPTLALEGAAYVARKANRPEIARKLTSKELFLKTDVANELEWLLYTEFFELPYAHRGENWRRASGDALAREILSDPRLIAQLEPMVLAAAREAAKPGGRAWLEETLTAYLGTRSATTELTTLVLCLSTGATLAHQVTPGLISLGTAVSKVAEGVLAAKGISGGALLGVLPPATAAAIGGTAAIVATASVLSAVSGAVTDPIQQSLGLHQRRLHQVLDLMEEAFLSGDRAPFVVADQYVGRIMDIADVGLALWHARPL
jgi:hypothetical protein